MKKIDELTEKIDREMVRQKKVSETIQENFFPTSKKSELRQRLKRYDAKFIKGRFVSITLENIESMKKYDPETLELIIDLGYKFQIKIKL